MPKQIQTNSDKSKGQPLDFDKMAANKYLKVGNPDKSRQIQTNPRGSPWTLTKWPLTNTSR
jgi:hypothetical protein